MNAGLCLPSDVTTLDFELNIADVGRPTGHIRIGDLMKHEMSVLALKLTGYAEEENGSLSGPYVHHEPIPAIGAIYLLWDEDVVVYVGITNNLCRRIFEHAKEKSFSHFSFHECSDEYQREDLECIFFETLNPVLNKEHPAQSHLRMHPYTQPFDDSEIAECDDENYSWYVN